MNPHDIHDMRTVHRGMLKPRAAIIVTAGKHSGGCTWSIALMESDTLDAILSNERVDAARVKIVSNPTPIAECDTPHLNTLAKALGCTCIHGLTFFTEHYASAGGAA